MRYLAAVAVASISLTHAGCGKPSGRSESGSGSAAKPAAGSAAPATAEPTLRLPGGARPVRYRASLEIDPAAASFKGHVEIDVEIERATDVIWLNGQDLSISRAVLRRGGAETPFVVEVMPRNFVALRGTTAAGDATLVFDYTGKQDASLGAGMRKNIDDGDTYVVTHFEPIGARRVFPSFDEPSFKVPWQIDLTVPAGNAAFTNTGVEAEEKLADGRLRVRFKETRPLPSYLICLAVGKFETVDAGKSRSGVPMRIIVPHGRGGEAGYAAVEVGKVLAALEDYIGSPYPYDKLDHIVLPGTLAGAMEHPGLITYGFRWLLIPESESAAARRGHVGIVAHELAHQWFGNLVTTAWWDDLWLNEAFATWLPPKAVQALHPEMDGDVDPASWRSTALGADVLATARRIREPITAEADMRGAFDGITYQKGGLVIRMFEALIGPEVFQRAARRYLAAHADKAVTAKEFLAALDAETGKPTSAAMATFLDQPGVPLVDMTLSCEAGKPAALQVTQGRFVAARAKGVAPAAGDALWHVPVCLRVPGEKQSRCTLVTTKTAEIPLGKTCPKWIVPNVGGYGYYLSRLPAPQTAALLGDGWRDLSRLERLVLVGDLGVMIDGGQAELDAILQLLPRLATADDPYLVEQALGRLEKLAKLAGGHEDAFAKLVRDLIGPHGKRLGWVPRRADSLADAKLRGRVMQLLAGDGRDAAAGQRAVALAKGWLASPKSVPESLWSAVVGGAVRADPKAMGPVLLERARTETDRVILRTIYGALSQVREAELQARLYKHALEAEPMTTERVSILGATPDTFERQTSRFELIRSKKDELLQRLPRDYRAALVATVCDARRRDEAAAYLQSLTTIPEIGELRVRQAIEAMDLCIARRASQEPVLATYLGSRR